jgi:hypothetical protein
MSTTIKQAVEGFLMNCKVEGNCLRTGKGVYGSLPELRSGNFFDNPLLLERLRFGGRLCPHKLEKKPCRGGHTTWCPTCRVRSFIYDN